MMPRFRFLVGTVLVAGAALAGVVTPARAVTLRVADQGDALSMDPHSQNEALQLSVLGNVYEPLVSRDRAFRLEPRLSTRWWRVAPTVWRFELRRGVRFHDGSPFTADDVIFSFERARGEGSDLRSTVAPIREIVAVDDHTVDVVTTAPFPILPDRITTWFMTSRRWCEANGATRPVDRRRGAENAASFRANGTGPFRLRERQPGVRTTFARNGTYWGTIDGNVDDVVFTPIGSDATRVAALLSGEVDVIEPVPVQDVQRIAANPAFRVWRGAELRVIFLGMDQRRDELLYSSVKGRNPFRDVRVRRAFFQAIDVDSIRKRVMRGAAFPAALMIAPEVRGFPSALATRLPYDPDAARRLLADAGYPSGFEVKLNCPNDRYVNDAEVCQAVAANLAKVGVRVALEAEAKGAYFTKVLRRDTSFFLLGWTPATVDAHDVLFTVLSSPGEHGRGQYNLGAYGNPSVDELTARIGIEADDAKRNAMIAEAMEIHRDDVGHIPLHQQALLWAARVGVDLVQWPTNNMPWRYVRIK